MNCKLSNDTEVGSIVGSEAGYQKLQQVLDGLQPGKGVQESLGPFPSMTGLFPFE